MSNVVVNDSTAPPAKDQKNARFVGEMLAAIPGAGLVAWAIRANDAWYERHMTAMFCFADPSQIAKAHRERIIAAIVGGVLLVVVRPRLARYFKRLTLASMPGAAARMTLALVLALVVSDVGLRWSRARAEKTFVPPPRTPRHDSAEAIDVGVGGRFVHYAVDNDGFRARSPTDVADKDAPSVLFVGESVAYGYGLNYEETIPALVSAESGVQAVNLALSASGTDEELFRLDHWLPKFSHPISVVTFVVYDWLYRNASNYRDHFAIASDGDLEVVHAQPKLLATSPLWDLLRAIYHPEDTVELTRVIMQKIAERARSRGAYPLFVLTQAGVKCLPADGNASRTLHTLTDKQPFAILTIDFDASETLDGDIHPNAHGAEKFAREIMRALREAHVVDAVPPPLR